MWGSGFRDSGGEGLELTIQDLDLRVFWAWDSRESGICDREL